MKLKGKVEPFFRAAELTNVTFRAPCTVIRVAAALRADALRAAAGLFVDRRPGTPFDFIFAYAAVFVAFFDVLGDAFRLCPEYLDLSPRGIRSLLNFDRTLSKQRVTTSEVSASVMASGRCAVCFEFLDVAHHLGVVEKVRRTECQQLIILLRQNLDFEREFERFRRRRAERDLPVIGHQAGVAFLQTVGDVARQLLRSERRVRYARNVFAACPPRPCNETPVSALRAQARTVAYVECVCTGACRRPRPISAKMKCHSLDGFLPRSGLPSAATNTMSSGSVSS